MAARGRLCVESSSARHLRPSRPAGQLWRWTFRVQFRPHNAVHAPAAARTRPRHACRTLPCRRALPSTRAHSCNKQMLPSSSTNAKTVVGPMQQRVNRRRSMPTARRSRPRSSSNAPAKRRPSPVSWQQVPYVGTQHAENNVPPGAPGPADAQDQSRARRSRPVVATRAPLGRDIWTCWQRRRVRRSRCTVRGRFRRRKSWSPSGDHIGLGVLTLLDAIPA